MIILYGRGTTLNFVNLYVVEIVPLLFIGAHLYHLLLAPLPFVIHGNCLATGTGIAFSWNLLCGKTVQECSYLSWW